MQADLVAGSAAVDITPSSPQFLFGYPHVPRMSSGVHDPLYCSALYLTDGHSPLLYVACDVIYVDRGLVARARARIEHATGIAASRVMVTATHTHSGPVTVTMLSNAEDTTVPPPDPHFLQTLEDGIVTAAVEAVRRAAPAQLGLGVADGTCVGGNRHDPRGPSDPTTPVLAVRDTQSRSLAALMVVCSMHPTVLHEDSTIISGDFPGMARRYLQQHVLGQNVPIIYHTGVCGNLSPRHVARNNTLEECIRLGTLLGKSIANTLTTIEYFEDLPLKCSRSLVDLPLREFPTVDEAQQLVAEAKRELTELRDRNADRGQIRTAECRLFGAEETLALSRAAFDGRLREMARTVLPAEVMATGVGPWTYVSWPGEIFVEYALEIKSRHRNCYLISLANGELQGYLVTEEAVRRGSYEALNAIFASPQSGQLLVEATEQLLTSADWQSRSRRDL